MKPWWVWSVTTLALLLPIAQASAQADALQVRSWAAACATCHGTAGVAQPGMPSLAGMPRDTLTRRLLDYKAGRQPATLMHRLARAYSDAQIEQIAAYFAALKPE